jgi:hypothetical protein
MLHHGAIDDEELEEFESMVNDTSTLMDKVLWILRLSAVENT